MDFSPDEKSPLVWMEGLIQANWDNSVGLESLLQSMPMDSVTLRNTRLQVAQRVLELVGNEPTESKGFAFHHVAVALSKLNRPSEALNYAFHAIGIFGELATREPNIFNPHLGNAYNTLSIILCSMNKNKEAIVAAQAAARIYLTLLLEDASSDILNRDLGLVFNNLAKFFSNLMQWKEALSAARESLSIRIKLLLKYHEKSFISDVAMSLNNLSKIFIALGQHEDALNAVKEAVKIYRNLAAFRPDIFNPDFSMSLNNLAYIHGHLKHHEEAINYALEAVAIRRNLVSKHRDVFNADLATSLFILAQQYEMNN
jgi:tetratricopeptide (TPR) repeat protein